MIVLEEAIESITKDNIKNWFKHDGYYFEPTGSNVKT